jgi:FtsH-binding integral membrane protein
MQVHLDSAYWLGLVISVVLPVLVGLVTTRVTSAGVKAVLLLALSTLNGFLVELTGPHDAGYSWQTAAVLALVSFAVGVLSHFGLWKPTGVSGKAQDTLVTSGAHAAGA